MIPKNPVEASMFIQTEPTPNPATLKFIPGRTVLGDGSVDYRAKAEAEGSPLALRLFDVDGVTGVFLGSDFISVTKSEGEEWQHLKPAILGAIMDHYLSGAPALASGRGDELAGEEEYDPEDEETVRTIKELLDTRVRPAVANDGGDIVFHGFRDGVVFLHMRGACAGCPSSTATLRHGIENLLRHFCPDVQEVRPV
jgi:Fe-S cluster biogenesis protein NfuA